MSGATERGGTEQPGTPANEVSAAGEDPCLSAATAGWGVTLRYGLLRLADRWPLAALGAAGAETTRIGAAIARARGWL